MALPQELARASLRELSAALGRRECCSRDIIRHYLDRIAARDAHLHAFVRVDAEHALALADAADAARQAGWPTSPLHGLPIVLKDLLEVEGGTTSLGSRHYIDRRSTETSATVERLLGAGMIPLGKVHMTEFAFGGWGTNPLMGTPRNPWDLQDHRVPGGSSSGTGVAVAGGLAPAGIGSDTGGSVRIPSAFNGITGLKVTWGRISLHATGLLSWTLDTIGPMAHEVQDCAWLLDVLAGPDPRDPATLGQPVESFARIRGWVKGVRIGVVKEDQLPDFMEDAVVENWREAVRAIASLGAQITAVELPSWFFSLAAATGRVIAAEAYHLHEAIIQNRSLPLGDAVRERILAAERFKPADYAGELRLMQQRRSAFLEGIRELDAITLPTVAAAAPRLPVNEASPLPAYLTRPVNYLGLCALAQPSGLADGLPTSVQWVGKPFEEARILALGAAYERTCGHHRMRAPLEVEGSESSA
jgi:aspartyl-tRNA(Asn)/glutamyl-tRNA(Gln) amidotransferase subunit A